MEPTEEKKCCETKKCGCCCHKMPGIFIIVIGVLILLRALDVLAFKPFWITISILIILCGLKCLLRGRCNCCNKS